MEATVRLEDVRKAYRPGLLRRPNEVLKGMSMCVGAGEVYALIGPNGAGKTTTFRLLLGMIRMDAGDGSIFGFPLGSMAARERLGFLPETPCYYPYLSVRELLRFAGRLSKISEVDRAIERALERFGLGPFRDRPLRRLSKGQLQRVGIAQASLHDPPLLILDEPMSGLDPLGRGDVKTWIREMREEGRTIVLASHVLADVEALADRVGLLYDGRIAVEGSAEDLLRGTEEEIEIEFAVPGDGADLIRGISATIEERAGLWAATLASGQEIETAALLSRILSHGGTIRSVRRRRQSLESFFIDAIRNGAATPDEAAEKRG